MEQNPYSPRFDALPDSLPIFPLGGVLLLPGGQLPLNIFERRYLDMVDHAMRHDRIFGMIQPLQTPENHDSPVPALYKTGCAGKIIDFKETPDGRYLITLNGICRFDIKEELPPQQGFRSIRANWAPYKQDLDGKDCLGLDRDHLHNLLKSYFSKEELECDWASIEKSTDNKLITCLSMICPFEARDKQALLEPPCCKTRGEMFISMLEMAVKGNVAEPLSQH
tara:strand:- start:1574 stop:2242 length:669 start_codon:yes stop_codon:yes gene_type:complete